MKSKGILVLDHWDMKILGNLAVPVFIDLNGEKQVTFGRARGNKVVSVLQTISRQHVILDYKNSSWWITDLSGNGILINSKPVEKLSKTKLSNGDVISLLPNKTAQYKYICVEFV